MVDGRGEGGWNKEPSESGREASGEVSLKDEEILQTERR